MPLPTTAQIVDIELGGKTRQMYFSFRAWKTLGINPTRLAEIQRFFVGDDTDPEGLTVDKAARWISAGIGGYQALMKRLAEDDGEPLPPICAEVWDVDRVLDLLDINILGTILAATGAAAETVENEKQPGNV